MAEFFAYAGLSPARQAGRPLSVSRAGPWSGAGTCHRRALTLRTAVMAAAIQGSRCSPSRTIRMLCRAVLTPAMGIRATGIPVPAGVRCGAMVTPPADPDQADRGADVVHRGGQLRLEAGGDAHGHDEPPQRAGRADDPGFADWAPDEADRHGILAESPERLFFSS